ncbi:MAG TPA: hypothetical protein VLW05_09190 [Gaiellaceae bacterium]|nr:hypothetical protein [Gaiellaceae bacterium]
MNGKRLAAFAAVALVAAIVGTAGAGLLHRVATSPLGSKVTVHGQWTIIVRNKQHRIVARRHFENSLVSTGAGTIAQLLTGNVVEGSWGVNVTFGAIVDQYNSASDSPPFYKNLVVTAPTSGPDVNKVVLSGTATPSADTTITQVDTYVGTCPLPSAGAHCTNTPAAPQFTHKALDGLNGDPAAVPVAAGQQVAVTVKLSFS